MPQDRNDQIRPMPIGKPVTVNQPAADQTFPPPIKIAGAEAVSRPKGRSAAKLARMAQQADKLENPPTEAPKHTSKSVYFSKGTMVDQLDEIIKNTDRPNVSVSSIIGQLVNGFVRKHQETPKDKGSIGYVSMDGVNIWC